jgi:hypothetical protein
MPNKVKLISINQMTVGRITYLGLKAALEHGIVGLKAAMEHGMTEDRYL